MSGYAIYVVLSFPRFIDLIDVSSVLVEPLLILLVNDDFFGNGSWFLDVSMLVNSLLVSLISWVLELCFCEWSLMDWLR